MVGKNDIITRRGLMGAMHILDHHLFYGNSAGN
jgi:hypothetical protein